MRILGLVGVALALMTTVGCAGKYTGGGSMNSAAGAHAKANVGFNLQASDTKL